MGFRDQHNRGLPFAFLWDPGFRRSRPMPLNDILGDPLRFYAHFLSTPFSSKQTLGLDGDAHRMPATDFGDLPEPLTGHLRFLGVREDMLTIPCRLFPCFLPG